MTDFPSKGEIRKLPDHKLVAFTKQALDWLQRDRKEAQILYYKPVSDKAQAVHDSMAHVIGVGGGNGSSKTESLLVDLVMRATGVYPISQRHLVEQTFRGPINTRIVVESITTTMTPVILPKLQWWKWTGTSEPGGERGHWGWIPKMCLKKGSWDKSWSEKYRTLTVLCRDPNDMSKVLGESTIQMMSWSQDSEDFASGDFHYVQLDEPPKYAIWTENQARTMRVNGVIRLSMTWPDDPSIPVDWLFDEVYEPGNDPGNKDVEWYEFWTTENPHLDQESIRRQMDKWSPEMVQVRIFGKPIRFSNRVHPLFTDIDNEWCFSCRKGSYSNSAGNCVTCDTPILRYNHVSEFEIGNWPVVFLLDPHPRKPHMMTWCAVDPADDLWVVAELEVEGDAEEVSDRARDLEDELGLTVAIRYIDPNMGRSPTAKRDITWQDEFWSAGIECTLASDSDVGRKRLNEYLKPDEGTEAPRFRIHPRCHNAIQQMKRYTWDEYRKADEKDLKQTPRKKNDDYPTLFKYLMNSEPEFRLLKYGAPVLRRGQRTGAYG